MKINIEQLVKTQQMVKELYEIASDINYKGVQIYGIENFMELAEECNCEIEEKERNCDTYPMRGCFYYKDVEFYTIY